MTFDEFAEEVRWILRYQDKKKVDIFLSIGEKPLGLHEWTEDAIEDVFERHYSESVSGGMPSDMAFNAAKKVMLMITSQNLTFPSRHYRKSSSQKIKESKKALKYLYALKEMQTTRHLDGLCLDIDLVQKSIDYIEDILLANEVMNTGGKPTNINDQDLVKLVTLKGLYAVCFPKNSNRYTPGNLLHHLGEFLIEKTIPRKIDSLIDKAIIHLRSHEE